MSRSMRILLLLATVSMAAPVALAQHSQQTPPTEPAEAATPAAPAKPETDITAEQLYRYLLGEISSQRGDARSAVEAFLSLARDTGDPRLAQRAAEAALRGSDPALATRAVRQWYTLEPENQRAEQTLIALLLSRGQMVEAQPMLQRTLARGDSLAAAKVFMQLAEIGARTADKQGAYQLIAELARGYPKVPEARLAVAQAAKDAQQTMVAVTESKAALDLKPGWAPAVLLLGDLLAEASPREAIALYREHLAKNPKARDVRVALARVLVAQRDLAGARKEYQTLLGDGPERPENYLAVALLSVDLKDYPAAETYLKKTLALKFRDASLVYAYLGEVAEAQKHYGEAIDWYRKVQPGEQYFSSQLHIAALLAKQGDLAAGRAQLRSLTNSNSGQRIQAVVADAQLLRDARAYDDAFQVLSDALAQEPDSTELLYDRAMTAEKLNRIDALESDLRKVMQLKPDYAHAYNALGYTLAERGIRLDEALQLIERAHELAPNDAFILDSLGWVHYRLGHLDQGLAYLKNALVVREDPEIAAHLAEVLLAKGNKAEARTVTRAALAKSPESEALRAIVKKIDAE